MSANTSEPHRIEAARGRTPARGALATGATRLWMPYAAAVVLGLGGLFTSWGGAVRWKDCWRSGPSCLPYEDDAYGLGPYPGRTGEPLPGVLGIAEPIAYGAALTFVGLLLLLIALRPWWLSVVAGVVSLGLVGTSALYWRYVGDPRADVWGEESVLSFVHGVFQLGTLAVVGIAGVVLWRSRRADRPGGAASLQVAGWAVVAVTGWALSFWGEYMTPMLWSASHDDPAWMWSFGGTVVVAAAAFLLWSLGRWSARPKNLPPPV